MKRRIRERRKDRRAAAQRRRLAHTQYDDSSDEDNLDAVGYEPPSQVAARHERVAEQVKDRKQGTVRGAERGTGGVHSVSSQAARQGVAPGSPTDKPGDPMTVSTEHPAPAAPPVTADTDDDPIRPVLAKPADQANQTQDQDARQGQPHTSDGNSNSLRSRRENTDQSEDSETNALVAAQHESEDVPALVMTEDEEEEVAPPDPNEEYYVARQRAHDETDTALLTRRVRALLRWENLLGHVLLTGRVSCSAELYEVFRDVINNMPSVPGNPTPTLEHYQTIRRRMKKKLVQWCFPKSSMLFLEDDNTSRDARGVNKVHTENAGWRDALSSARVILPSEWARLDVATYTFYSDVYEHPARAQPSHLSIETAPVVQRRAPFIGREIPLWSLFSNTPCVTKKGDTVLIPCAARPRQAEAGRTPMQGWFHTGEKPSSTCQVRAVYCGSWLIPEGASTESAVNEPAQVLKGQDKWTKHERALRTKFSRPSPNSPAMELVLEQEHVARVAQLDVDGNVQAHLPYSRNVIELHPGDICILFRAEETNKTIRAEGSQYVEPMKTQHCLLVGSLVRPTLGLSAERLVWLDIDERAQGRATVRYVGSANVVDLPLWIEGPRGTPHHECEHGETRNMGFLADGSRFVVYRFALYFDAFKQLESIGDAKQVGGFYLLPMGLSLRSRRGKGAPRVITLGSHSASHNGVMDLVLEDVSRAAAEGVSGVDPYNRKVRIFLDPVTFLGDYPAVAKCGDSMGHVANAHCTHCTVRRQTAPNGSKILSTSMNNSRRAGYMRTDARLQAIRRSDLHKSTYQRLGMKSRDMETAMAMPLVKLSSLLNRAVRPERDFAGRELTPVMFESSLSCAAVPDHVLYGLTKNALHVSFKALDSDDRRATVERTIVSTVRANGLKFTGRLLRVESGGTYKGLETLTMSMLSSVLMCAAPAFDAEYQRTDTRVFRLPRLLHNFASAVYFWPCERTGGAADARMLTSRGRTHYYGQLRRMILEYLKECDAVMTENAELGAELDKPNAHRAVELAVHTIPTFGHALNCSELVMESMHQVFKQWLRKNAHSDSHITAVEHALSADWAGRVFANFKIWECGTARERACSETSLRRLLLGEEGVVLNERQVGVPELRALFHASMQEALCRPVHNLMGSNGHISLPRGARLTWDVLKKDKLSAHAQNKLEKEFSKGRADLRALYQLREGESGLTVFSAARLVSHDVYEGQKNSYPFNELKTGYVLSCPVVHSARSKAIIKDEDTVRGELCFFAVLAVVMGPDGRLWVIALPMVDARMSARAGGAVVQGMQVVRGAGVVLELSEAVRRAGIAHHCDENCAAVRPPRLWKHSAGVLEGGLYEVWSRRNGYPPHAG